MENMVNVYFFGKKYSVPAELTIMTAMEYAGYTLKRGCGCRHGFCGACATIYRIKGQNELKTCLACQTQVQEGMYVASIPFFPTDKRTYDINEIKPNQQVMMELYPEIYSCIGCNACTVNAKYLTKTAFLRLMAGKGYNGSMLPSGRIKTVLRGFRFICLTASLSKILTNFMVSIRQGKTASQKDLLRISPLMILSQVQRQKGDNVCLK